MTDGSQAAGRAVAAARRSRLLGDIGGTNARFALLDENGRIRDEQRLLVRDFPGLVEAARHYLGGRRVEEAVFAVATPVESDRVSFTNSPWTFEVSALDEALGTSKSAVVNDFVAQARALPHLEDADVTKLGGGPHLDGRLKAAIGPGTGLGVSALVPIPGGWLPIPGEGGHVSFAPGDAREQAILAHLWQSFEHVSDERLVSGPGLLTLARTLAALDGEALEVASPADVVQHASHGSPVCREAIARFSGMLGSAAGDLALTLGARGGVYVCGGVVLSLEDAFDVRAFRTRFEAKGRFRGYLEAIPTYVVRNPSTGLIGVAHHDLAIPA